MTNLVSTWVLLAIVTKTSDENNHVKDVKIFNREKLKQFHHLIQFVCNLCGMILLSQIVLLM